MHYVRIYGLLKFQLNTYKYCTCKPKKLQFVSENQINYQYFLCRRFQLMRSYQTINTDSYTSVPGNPFTGIFINSIYFISISRKYEKLKKSFQLRENIFKVLQKLQLHASLQSCLVNFCKVCVKGYCSHFCDHNCLLVRINSLLPQPATANNCFTVV